MPSSLIDNVQSLYERRPYPHYPLLATPLWQDGYLGASLFAQQLFDGLSESSKNQSGRPSSDSDGYLSIGSGEILPFVIRKWEPSSIPVTCIDLSQRSLKRAKLRTLLLPGKLTYRQADINDFLSSNTDLRYDYIEAYGVLHHIPNFAITVDQIAKHLTPRGVVRVMVYNRLARDWIWQISRAFRALNLTFHSNSDISTARDVLRALARLSPRLQSRLSQLGPTSLDNNSRFADTFMHPWEARTSIYDWFAVFKNAGLSPLALFDRYAELDDLPNPLWKCPTVDELSERADDLRFENNLELWLGHSEPHRSERSTVKNQGASRSTHGIVPPPAVTHRFDAYVETQYLTRDERMMVWREFISALTGNPNNLLCIKNWQKLPILTLQRLGRMGLIFPSTARELGRYQELLKPIHATMNPPILPPTSSFNIKKTVIEFFPTLQSKEKKLNAICRRLERVL